MTHTIQALSISPATQAWLRSTQTARVLHAFNAACNLINSSGKVLSLVTPAIGNGPFSLVVPQIDLLEFVDQDSPVRVTDEGLTLGQLRVETSKAKPWHPRPPWSALHEHKAALLKYRHNLEVVLTTEAPNESIARVVLNLTNNQAEDSKITTLATEGVDWLTEGLSHDQTDLIASGAARLAGLGVGLTPAGDDFLMGVMYGLWALKSEKEAFRLSQTIYQVAAPRTTSLSAAWLGAAARGEAGESWHALFEAILHDDKKAFRAAIYRILPTGHTSGVDALAGFFHVTGINTP